MNATLNDTATPARRTPPAAAADAEARRLAWWRRVRFGMFIHWGPYCLMAGQWRGQRIDDGIGHGVGEWIMYNAQIPVADYARVARGFNPVEFDADDWAALAERTGQKYLIFTTKHHDGFAMFKSGVSDYNIVDGAPFGRDVVAELAAACSRRGIRFGLYYSQAQDWTHPGGAAFNGRNDPTAPWSGGTPGAGRWDPAQEGDFDAYLKNIAQPQVLELLTRYGPIDIFWWDTPIGMTPERAAPFRDLLRLQPGIITNNRLLDPDRPNAFSGDTETPEQFIPATGLKGRDFEVCMTVNDTWGYKEHDHNWKSPRTLIRQLVDTVSKGGNFLLNIGPDGQGRIPAPCRERLEAVGCWMDTNAESIDDAQASPFAKLPWGRCTRRDHNGQTFLYLHVFRWPHNGSLPVPGLCSEIAEARLLAGGEALKTVRQGNETLVLVPLDAPDADVSVVRLRLKGELKVLPSLPRSDSDGRISLPAWQASLHNRSYGGQAVLDLDADRPAIREWTDPQTHLTWDFESTTAGTVEISADWLTAPAEARLRVSIGEESQEVAIPGGTVPGMSPLGQLPLPRPGTFRLTLEPLPEGWQPAELAALELRVSK